MGHPDQMRSEYSCIFNQHFYPSNIHLMKYAVLPTQGEQILELTNTQVEIIARIYDKIVNYFQPTIL